jgi:hypothetical protein
MSKTQSLQRYGRCKAADGTACSKWIWTRIRTVMVGWGECCCTYHETSYCRLNEINSVLSWLLATSFVFKLSWKAIAKATFSNEEYADIHYLYRDGNAWAVLKEYQSQFPNRVPDWWVYSSVTRIWEKNGKFVSTRHQRPLRSGGQPETNY